MEIRFDTRVIERFKRRARKKHPFEYLEVLFGSSQEDVIDIRASEVIEHTATSSTAGDAELAWDSKDLEPLKRKAAEKGMIWCGTLHSHPNGTERPSDSDNQDAADKKELVFGIYSYEKLPSGRLSKGKLTWWFPQLPAKASPHETTPSPIPSPLPNPGDGDQRQDHGPDGTGALE